MLIAGLMFAIMNVFVKMVPNIPAIEVVLFRSIVSFTITLGYLKYLKIPVFGDQKFLLISRGLAGAISLSIYFYTLQNIPLASAVTMQFLSPIFTSILGIYLVKERVYSWQWFFYLLAFGGLLMIQGFDPRVSPTMLVLGIIASFFAGLAYTLIRKINKKEHPLVIVFYFPLVTTPLAAIYCYFNWVTPIGNEWYVLILIGVLTQIAQYFMTKSYQEEDISKVASIKYLSVVYAVGFGYVFFQETFPLEVFLGMFLIILGVVANIIYKTNKSKADKNLQK